MDSVDRFLLREIELSVDRRANHWKRDASSVQKYNASIEPNRRRLAHMIAVRDGRVPFDGLELVATTEQPGLGGGPGRLVTPKLEDVKREVRRAGELTAGLEAAEQAKLIVSADGDRRATVGQQKLLATSLPRCDICIKLVWESAIAVRLSASRVAYSAAVRYLVSPVSVVKPSRVRKSDCWLAKLQSTQVSPSFFQRTGPKSKRRSSFMAYVYKVEYLQ